MRLSSLVCTVAVVMSAFGLANGAQAAPITYEISGIASGTIGGAVFTDALVTVTMHGDTDNVLTDPFPDEFPCDFCTVNASSLTTVAIAGIGTATVTQPTGIWGFAQPVDLDDDDPLPTLPVVVMGTVDDPPLLNSFTGLAGVASDGLLGYFLNTPFGPHTATPGGVFYPVDLFVQTNFGNLSFTRNLELDMEGTFTATVAPVPEPASVLLLGVGVATVARRIRRRAQR